MAFLLSSSIEGKILLIIKVDRSSETVEEPIRQLVSLYRETHFINQCCLVAKVVQEMRVQDKYE